MHEAPAIATNMTSISEASLQGAEIIQVALDGVNGVKCTVRLKDGTITSVDAATMAEGCDAKATMLINYLVRCHIAST